MMNPFSRFYNPANNFLGTISSKNKKKREAVDYVKGKRNAIAKRRARNKVARKARRLNQIRADKKCVKFYS